MFLLKQPQIILKLFHGHSESDKKIKPVKEANEVLDYKYYYLAARLKCRAPAAKKRGGL